MIQREFGKIVFYCDGSRCPEALETNEVDFHDARLQLRDDGWAARHDPKLGWLHICPDCLATETEGTLK